MSLRAGGLTGLMNQPSAQVVDGSLKFENDNENYLSKTFSSSGNRTKWSWSSWVKRNELGRVQRIWNTVGGASNDDNWFAIAFTINDEIFLGGYTSIFRTTSAKFRDIGAWMHIVVYVDLDASTTMKVWVNGVEQTLSGSTDPSQTGINSTLEHRIGMETNSSTACSLQIANAYFIDGQKLGPSYFGFTDPLTGTWRPKLLKDGDQATPNTHLLYNVNTSDNGFDSSSTSRTYDVTSREFSTYTTPQTANPGGYGANSAHVYKSPTGHAITWIVSTSTSDRYIWTSEDGVNWTSKGSFYDTDGSSQSVTSTYIALAGGSNASNVTVTSATVDFGTNGFYLPMDGKSPIGQDKSGKGNNWTPVNFGGFDSVDKATGALPILEGPGGIVANVATRTDENASSLALALPLVGNANDVHHHIKGSGSAKTITVNGNADASSDQSNFYGGSFEFDGTGDYLAVTNTSDLVFGTGAFTIECWIYAETYNSVTYPTVISKYDDGDASWILRLKSDGDIVWYDGNNNESTTQPISLNEWIHLAVVREGTGSNQTKVYVNGVLHLTHTDSSNYDDTNNIYIGRQDASNANEFDGYIQDVRIYKGVAKYTSNFVPASTNPDILPDTPSGVSGGSKLTKITDGAVTFDGTGDYLSLGDSDDFNLVSSGTGDFTIEFYVYLPDISSRYVLSSGTDATRCYINGSTRLHLNNPTDSFLMESSTAAAAIKANKWTHIAFCKSSSTGYIFVDGIQYSFHSGPALGGDLDFNDLRIGRTSTSLNGFISNLRILKGTALYTSNFTPPSAPLTNVTNTKLLCCQSNTQPGAAAVSPNGTTVWSESVTLSNTSTQFPIERGFDGVITGDGGTAGFAGWLSGAGSITITFPSGVSVSNTIDIYHGDGLAGSTTASITVDGTTTNSSASSGYVTTKSFSSISGDLESITLTQAGGGVRFYGIDIDGTVLKNPVIVNGDTVATNFNPFNTDINTVRGQETGYATLNPLKKSSGSTLSNGNLDISMDGNQGTTFATMGFPTTGKWFFECTANATQCDVGIAKADADLSQYVGKNSSGYGYYVDGNVYNNDASAGSGATYTTGDVIGVAFDADAGTCKWYKNNILQVTISSLSGEWFPAFGSGNAAGKFNFGQKPFKFPPPEGFQPLNGTNLIPETVIARPDQYVDISTWTGTGAVITRNLNTKPDLVWIKGREDGASGAYDHRLFDSVRGLNGETGKAIYSSANVAEGAYNGGGSNNDGAITAIPKGFTISTSGNRINENGVDQVAWCWKAGGNKNTFNVDDVGYASAAAAGITDGTISLTGASVGTRQGFSIIKYAGSGSNGTLAHGLSQAPDFFFGRDLEDTGGSRDWIIYHKSIGATGRLKFTTDSTSSSSVFFQDTSPTNSLITVGTSNDINSTNDYVLYCWHDVPGLQKFGSYVSNGNTDGNFVELGFKPALLMIKSKDYSATNTSWAMYTSDLYPNQYQNALFANKNAAEGVRGDGSSTGSMNQQAVDLLSNGFKLRNNGSETNEGSSNEYIYCAWAEAPSINLYGGQSNAR